MGLLLAVNALMFLFLHVIWAKGDFLNLVIKILFLGLLLVNGFSSYQVFEVDRLAALEKVSK